ncbi:hypothetical protein BMS3Abin10_00471 [bacterium BMS3Abin10]|nr:hypothetical protein BMS3Abin10_00471 [bacterium BMS3Abin10]
MKSRNLLWLMVLTVIMVFVAGNAYSAAVELPQTGQTTSYASGDDGDLLMGVAWPSPRFVNNGDGTITDDLTGLVWLQNANCYDVVNWKVAFDNIFVLANGGCGLTDGSSAGDWRMPNYNEMESLIGVGGDIPTWLGTAGFTGLQGGATDFYWVSTIYLREASYPWVINMGEGRFSYWSSWDGGSRNDNAFVLPVRGTAEGTGTVDLPQTGDDMCVYRVDATTWAVDPDCTASGTGTWAPVVLEDGALQMGVALPATGISPSGRYSNNYNGTVTDLVTDLLWTQSGNVVLDKNPAGTGQIDTWQGALDFIADMNNGTNLSGLCASPCENYGYTGWRLPNRKEMMSLLYFGDLGGGYIDGWLESEVFVNVSSGGPASLGQSDRSSYWTSTTDPADTANIFGVTVDFGEAHSYSKTSTTAPNWHAHGFVEPYPYFIWPVRDTATAPYGLGVGIEPAGGGSVTGTGFNCPGDCSQIYTGDTTGIVLTATPYLGSTFDFWTGCDNPNANQCTMDVVGMTRGVVANFKVPDERIDPMAVVFGNVDVGLTAQRTVTISNYETVTYDVGTIPALTAPFSIVTDNCSGVTLSALTGYSDVVVGTGNGSNTTFNFTLNNPVVEKSTAVSYKPTGELWQTILDMVSDAGGSYNKAGSAGVAGTINYSSGAVSMTFNTAIQGSQNITVDYTQGPVDSCDIIIAFAPTSAGSFEGTLNIPNLKSAALTGTGVSVQGLNPDIAVSSVDMSFMNIPVGDTFTRSITVWNDGSADLAITSVSGPANEFSIALEDCTTNSPIDPSGAETCTIDIMYTAPGTPGGVHFSTLQIQSDDPDENPVVVNLSGSALTGNTPPTRPVLVSPVNGATTSAFSFTWEDGEDSDICIATGVPAGCDDTQTLTNTLYLATDPGFQNLVMPVAALDSSSVSYAMVLGNPVFMIALFGLVAFGVFLRRKKIALIIIAVMFTGLLLASCANHKDTAGDGGGAGGGALQAGVTYYWKVIADDGQGGTAESETWSFTTGQ